MVGHTKEWYEQVRSKKIYVYYDEEGNDTFIHSTERLKTLLDKKCPVIRTTNTYALTFEVYDWGYDLYLVRHGITMKVYPGMDCPSTEMELKFGHNLERLVRAGAVDTVSQIK